MVISKDKIISEAKETIAIIEVAIEVIQKFPPNDFDTLQLSLIIKGYLEFKEDVVTALSHLKYSRIKEVRYMALTYFQEGSGATVNNFWSELKSRNIKLERINKLDKIFKRNKIANLNEYDYVIDMIVAAEQEKLITEEQVIKLNDMIEKFESKK